MTDIEARLSQALASPAPRGPDAEFAAGVQKRVRAATQVRAILLTLVTTAAAVLGVGLLAGLVMSGPAWTWLFSAAWIPLAPASAQFLMPVALCLFAALSLAPLLRPSE
jgi:hypothetical protein